jgi:hypothetical protein
MLEGVRNDVSYVGLRCLDCICFAGEFNPYLCANHCVLYLFPTSLGILLSVSARMPSLYGHASLLVVSRGLSLSTLLGPARCPCHLGTAYHIRHVRGIQPL